MKEYNIYNQLIHHKSGDYYEVKYSDYSKTYETYEDSIKDIYKYYKNIKTVEANESKAALEERLQREKVNKRNNKIDQILG